ncbi:unnamed protein product [Spirodela intermedia]|uniref:Uncharacterized protein n=1 Tax=Spirodela intermedia TaxID=51605 RepID=A0A7I8IPW5_SPIIN|nr:unnamed protein product [Spirodela intermedia]CAA6659822.1 unnamed protein product [Spirodela intermedia]
MGKLSILKDGMANLLLLLLLRQDRRRGAPAIFTAIVLLAVAVVLTPAASEQSNEGVDAPSAPEKTVREVLRSHGLPIGLVPHGVKEFRIDGEGRFQVQLERPCNARFENEVHYDANITGRLATELFLWFPVKGIRVDIPSSGLIYFDVGVIFKQFSLSLFETPPTARPTSFRRRPPRGHRDRPRH